MSSPSATTPQRASRSEATAVRSQRRAPRQTQRSRRREPLKRAIAARLNPAAAEVAIEIVASRSSGRNTWRSVARDPCGKPLLSTAAGLSAFALLSPAWAVDCEGLKTAKIADTTILSAEAVPAGDLTTADKVTRKDMPAFCRVVASVKDAPDSDVRVELWMPNEGWKGVFHVNGNGGYAGVLAYNYGAMEAAIRRGYVSAETRPRHGAGDAAQRRRPHRASRQVERLGHAGDPRGGGRRQADRQSVLWRGRQALLLHRLLDRRSAGNRSKRNISPRISTAFSPARRSSTGHGATRSP